MMPMLDTFPLVKWDSVESARQSHQSLATQNKIASYRLCVDRKRAEWLQEHIENGGDRRSESQFPRVTLKSVGITNKESHILQRLARLPRDVFHNHIVSTLRSGDELTTASLLRVENALHFKNRKAPPLPRGRFSVIYADIPFEYEYAHSSIKPATSHYPTMSIAKICAMGRDIQKLSARNCTLLPWVPAPHLDKFPAILDAWDFRFCTYWVWWKRKPTSHTTARSRTK